MFFGKQSWPLALNADRFDEGIEPRITPNSLHW